MAFSKQKYPEVTVGGLVFNRRGELLLAKSWKWKNKLTIPGGHIEMGETAEEALKREIKEEIGVEVESPEFLMYQDAIGPKNFHKKKHFLFLDFVCKLKSGKARPDKDELDSIIWTKPENALKLDIDSFTRKSIKKYLKKE
jgi:nucleoside triphosphatase